MSAVADRFYANFHGGWIFSSTADDTATKPSNPTIVSKAINKPGYIVGVAAGRDLGNFRLESELNYSNGAIDHVHVVSSGGFR